MSIFFMFIRGVECEVHGYEEGPDPGVGGSYFEIEDIIVIESFDPEPIGFAELTDSEFVDIERAYWQSRPFEEVDHCVYEWGLT